MILRLIISIALTILIFTPFSCVERMESRNSDSDQKERKYLIHKSFLNLKRNDVLDSGLLNSKKDFSLHNNYFENNSQYYSHTSYLVTKLKSIENTDHYLFTVEQDENIDTIFTFRIISDSLYLFDSYNKIWEFKINLLAFKEKELENMPFSETGYLYSHWFNKFILKVTIVDVYEILVSSHSRNKDIKFHEMYFNLHKELIAFKYNGTYFYLNRKLSPAPVRGY